MRCPRDGSELKTRIYEANVEIDECPTCSGVFLDQGELETIQAVVEKEHEELAGRAPASLDPPSTDAPVACAQCGLTMSRRNYGFGSQVVIDACPDGCGLWLDGGELQQLERFYEKSQEEAHIPLMWRVWAAVRGTVSPRKSK
jgi:Zn-finger nucleic acid-binding protein